MTLYFKNVVLRKRCLGQRIALITAGILFVVSLCYLLINPGALKITDDSRTLTFLAFFFGSLITLSLLFYNQDILSAILPFISLILYALGWGRMLYLTAYPLADKITGVNWFGGNLAIFLTFFILFGLGTVAHIVSLFLPRTEGER